MITNEAHLQQAIEQSQGLCRAIESLRADIFPKNPKNFAILAEGPVDSPPPGPLKVRRLVRWTTRHLVQWKAHHPDR